MSDEENNQNLPAVLVQVLSAALDPEAIDRCYLRVLQGLADLDIVNAFLSLAEELKDEPKELTIHALLKHKERRENLQAASRAFVAQAQTICMILDRLGSRTDTREIVEGIKELKGKVDAQARQTARARKT